MVNCRMDSALIKNAKFGVISLFVFLLSVHKKTAADEIVNLPKSPPPAPADSLPEWTLIRPDIWSWNGRKDFYIRLAVVNGLDVVRRMNHNNPETKSVTGMALKVNDAIKNGTKVQMESDYGLKFNFNVNALKMNMIAETTINYLNLKTYIDKNKIISGIYVGPTYLEHNTETKMNTVGYRMSF